MISGRSAAAAARGSTGALYYTLEELRHHWQRIDILAPHAHGLPAETRLFDNVWIHISPKRILRHPWWLARYGAQLHTQYHYRSVVVQEYPPFYNGLGAYLLWRCTQLPYILQFHHIPGYPRAADWREDVQRKAIQWFASADARHATAVQVVNQRQTPDFLAKAGVPRNKLIYIPSLYIDLQTYTPVVTKRVFDCILVGRLVLNKGLGLFLEALAQTQATACIVGEGPQRTAVEQRIQALGLQHRVQLHGWARDAAEISTLMRQAGMLVVASYNEGGPRVAVEAMACGVPVVTTHVGIMEDLGRNGETVVFADWQPAALAQAIERVRHDTTLHARLASAGLAIAARFERRATIANFANEIKRLTS